MLVFVYMLAAVVALRIISCWLNNPEFKGRQGERIVAERLRSGLPTSYRLLNDVYLPLSDGTTTQIDHIVVSEYGVFVVETKNYSGWIFGDARSARWTQTLLRGKRRSFQNPIRQNYRHICALAEALDLPKGDVIGVVAFTGSCEFKTPMPDSVVYSRRAAEYIRSFTTVRFPAERVSMIVASIEARHAAVTPEQKAAHVGNLGLRHGGGASW